MLATTENNKLRSVTNGVERGLGVVRYWTYTKHPLDDGGDCPWEANFPTTIYLVGCNPPYAVVLYCTGYPTHKVLYHTEHICTTTNPGGAYIISWDRRAYCPIDLAEICEDGEEDPGVVVVEKATLDLCLTITGDIIGFPVLTMLVDGFLRTSIRGCVTPWWVRRRVDGEVRCIQQPANGICVLSLTNGAMSGNSTIGWSRGPIYISPDGAVSLNGVAAYGAETVSYQGTGDDISLDDLWGCPIGGPSSIDVLAVNWTAASWLPYSGVCCPEGVQCDDHPWDCNAGTIEITTSIHIVGNPC